MASIKNDFSIYAPATTLDPYGIGDGFTLPTVTVDNSNIKENATAAIEKYKNNNVNSSALVFPTTRSKYHLEMQIMDYDRADMFKLNINPTSKIILPMPDKIIDPNPVGYTEQDLGIMAGTAAHFGGAGIKKGIEGVQNAMSGGDAQKSLNDVGSAFGSLGALFGAAGVGALLSGVDNSIFGGAFQNASNQTKAAVSALAGYSPNQFFTVLFTGPQYKRYSFSWLLMPKNKQESNIIQKMYYKIQESRAPGKALGGLFWKYPKVFRLGYHPNSKYLNKFKPAVLADFTADFAPRSMVSFFKGSGDENSIDNAPEAVMFHCSFIELEYWLDEDYTDALANDASPFPGV